MPTEFSIDPVGGPCLERRAHRLQARELQHQDEDRLSRASRFDGDSAFHNLLLQKTRLWHTRLSLAH